MSTIPLFVWPLGPVINTEPVRYVVNKVDHDRVVDTLREQNRVLAEAFTKTTKGKVTINRYEHGGGRMFVDDGKNRDLIADTYNEGDREFIALCYEVFSKRAALTATSQPTKPQGRMHACDIPGCVSCGNPEDTTSQEGQG